MDHHDFDCVHGGEEEAIMTRMPLKQRILADGHGQRDKVGAAQSRHWQQQRRVKYPAELLQFPSTGSRHTAMLSTQLRAVSLSDDLQQRAVGTKVYFCNCPSHPTCSYKSEESGKLAAHQSRSKSG